LVLDPHEKLTILAKIAEQSESPKDMKDYMKLRCATGIALNADERDMLSAAYKAEISELRTAIDTAHHEVEDMKLKNRVMEAGYARGFAFRVGTELSETCTELIQMVDPLLEKAEVGEPKTFYLKLQADYYRYMAETPYAQGTLTQKQLVEMCRTAYTTALKEAEFQLLTTHPVRLGLALNFAVFQAESLSEVSAALETARMARSGALQALEGMPEEAWVDAAPLVMQLEDNIERWMSQLDAERRQQQEEIIYGESPAQPKSH